MEAAAENIYKDILELRRTKLFGDSQFYLYANNYYPFSRKSLPEISQDIRKCVFRSPRLSHIVRQISKDEDIPEEKLWLQIDSLLSNMAHDFFLPILKPVSYLCCMIARRLFRNLYVNMDGLENAMELMKHQPVLLMPTHRSYFDFVLMPMTFMQLGLAPPAVVAGDNLSRGFLGKTVKSCGAIAIRRSLGNDSLYKCLLSEYIHNCIVSADVPLEVFVEGGRSRNSLQMKPKKGILSMALEPYFFGLLHDIALVPISVSYDRIVEERLYAQEELGAQKEKESATTLLSALSQLFNTTEAYGNALVHFCDPILMSRYFRLEGKDLRHQHSVGPRHVHMLSEEERDMVEKLGWRVAEEQQKHMVLFPFAVASLAIRHTNVPIDLEDLEIYYQELRKAFNLVGANLYGDGADLEKALRTHSSVVDMTEDGMVKIKSNGEMNLRSQHLKSSTLEVAMVHVLLQHERNKSLQFLVRSAILVTVLRDRCQKENVDENLTFLLNLLSEDFVFLKSTSENREELIDEGRLLGIVQETPEGLAFGKNAHLIHILSYQLEPFLTAYAALATILSTNSDVLEEKKVMELAQGEVEKMLDKGDTQHYASLSLSVLKHGLQALVRLGAATNQFITEGSRNKLLVLPCCEYAEILRSKIISFIQLHNDNFTPLSGKL